MGGIKCHMGVQYGIVVLKKTIVKVKYCKNCDLSLPLGSIPKLTLRVPNQSQRYKLKVHSHLQLGK